MTSSVTNVWILKFLFFKSVIPTADQGTDLMTFVTLWSQGHPNWAFLTLFWVFLPWLFQVLIVILVWMRSFCKDEKFCEKMKKSFTYFPMVGPIKMFWNAVWMFRNKKEQSWMDDKEKEERNAKIKTILQEASSHGLQETFLESFCQMVTQGSQQNSQADKL